MLNLTEYSPTKADKAQMGVTVGRKTNWERSVIGRLDSSDAQKIADVFSDHDSKIVPWLLQAVLGDKYNDPKLRESELGMIVAQIAYGFSEEK